MGKLRKWRWTWGQRRGLPGRLGKPGKWALDGAIRLNFVIEACPGLGGDASGGERELSAPDRLPEARAAR